MKYFNGFYWRVAYLIWARMSFQLLLIGLQSMHISIHWNNHLLAFLFFDNAVKLQSMPTIMSDRDKILVSTSWQKTLKHHGTQLALSSMYHPHDGQTRRVNSAYRLIW
jgi:hypothetical protein